MNKRQLRILEDNFNIYKDNDNWDLEAWTSGGVDMFININAKNDIVEELKNYLDNFNMDEEIDLYRQDKDYKNNFTITESVRDFEDWVSFIKDIIKKLEDSKEEYMQVDINLLSETIDSLGSMIDYADDGTLSRYDSEYKEFFESVDKARETLEKLNKLYVEKEENNYE